MQILYRYVLIVSWSLYHTYTISIDVLLAPDNDRAQNNVRYYKNMLAEKAEEARKKQNQRGETGEEPPEEPVQEEEVKHERILDEYRNSEEFSTYEKLCRGESTHVGFKRKQKCMICVYYSASMYPAFWLAEASVDKMTVTGLHYIDNN